MSEDAEAQDHEPTHIETIAFDNGEILRFTQTEIRLDPRTGEKIRPLLFLQGINGDVKLPWTLEALGKEEQREIIAIKYPGKLQGSASELERFGEPDDQSVVTQMDTEQANDITTILDSLHLDAVDAVAESRGAIRLLTAMAKNPTRFKNAFLAHPAGLDGRDYDQAHKDALRQATNHAARKVLGKINQDDIDIGRHPHGGRLLRDPRGWRKEQKSVAYADVRSAIRGYARDSEKQIIVAADINDKAFLAERLAENANGSNVRFVQTDWGGHGIGFNRKAIKEISEGIRTMENSASKDQ